MRVLQAVLRTRRPCAQLFTLQVCACVLLCPRACTGDPNVGPAAVATSGPVLAKLDFVEYLEVVTASLGTATNGQECVSRITSAAAQIDSMLTTTQGTGQLATMFSLCSPPVSQLDKANFVSSVGGSFMVRWGGSGCCVASNP